MGNEQNYSKNLISVSLACCRVDQYFALVIGMTLQRKRKKEKEKIRTFRLKRLDQQRQHDNLI